MTAAIYIRVSSLEPGREKYSLPAQERALRDWCANHQYAVYKVYADRGISGKDIKHRPAMTQLLQDAKEGCFGAVLVWDLSRFARSVADLYKSLELFKARGINLISLTEAFDLSTPMGRAMCGTISVFAQLERELAAERTRAAMRERATQGKRTCSLVLGYDLYGPDSLLINPQEAETVRYIFDRYLEYRNLSAVAELCQLKGFRGKRGREFKAQHIRMILTRPIYAGYYSFNGRTYRGQHEPIISVQTYNRVQKLLMQSSSGRKMSRPLKMLGD